MHIDRVYSEFPVSSCQATRGASDGSPTPGPDATGIRLYSPQMHVPHARAQGAKHAIVMPSKGLWLPLCFWRSTKSDSLVLYYFSKSPCTTLCYYKRLRFPQTSLITTVNSPRDSVMSQALMITLPDFSSLTDEQKTTWHTLYDRGSIEGLQEEILSHTSSLKTVLTDLRSLSRTDEQGMSFSMTRLLNYYEHQLDRLADSHDRVLKQLAEEATAADPGALDAASRYLADRKEDIALLQGYIDQNRMLFQKQSKAKSNDLKTHLTKITDALEGQWQTVRNFADQLTDDRYRAINRSTASARIQQDDSIPFVPPEG